MLTFAKSMTEYMRMGRVILNRQGFSHKHSKSSCTNWWQVTKRVRGKAGVCVKHVKVTLVATGRQQSLTLTLFRPECVNSKGRQNMGEQRPF